MKKSIIITFLWTLIPTVIATPIDFDSLHIASTGYGTVAAEGYPRLLAAYNNNIYFIVSDDGTANPSKICRYNPSDGLSNTANHSIIKETTGKFVTLRQIKGLLYFSDSLGHVYFCDGSTVTAMSGTPFTADNYVSSVEEYNGLIYFGTSISSVYRFDGYTYEQVYGAINRVPILDMTTWQKNGYLYVSVGNENVCCPPTGYTIKSNSGDADSWETVFQGVYHTDILMPTPNYLYTAVMDSAYWPGSSIRKSSDGASFPVISQSSGEYKAGWGSLYYDGIAYFFVSGNYSVIDENGSVSLVPNQNWLLTQAIELNGEIYALAGSYDGYMPGGVSGDVYLITTCTLTVVSPDGGEEFISGKTETITWKALDSIENVSIEYSADNGLTWTVIAANTPNDGEYDWTLPSVTSNKCLIRISDVSDLNVSDISDAVFSIYECHLQLPGDLNNDCYVNLADLAILAQNWMRCSNPLDENCNIFTEVAFIPTGDGLSGRTGGIVLSPDESSLFAASWADTSADPVQQFSLADYSMTNTMSYGRCHGDAGVSANGRYVFVSSYYESNVSRFDLQNNNQRTDLSANYSWPGLVATTPDRQKLIALGGKDGRSYDMNNDGISIYDISGDNFVLLGTVGLPDEPVAVGFSPDGNFAYVSTYARDSSQPKLYEISISGTYQIVRSIAFDSVRLGAVALVGNDIYVADFTNSRLLVVDRMGDFTSVKNTYNLESGPGSIKLHPNGRDLYILMPNINKLVVWDTINKLIYGRYDQLNNGSNDIEFGSDGRIFIPNSSVTNNGIKVLR